MDNVSNAHPSVRIKGTETVYYPVQCPESSCSDDKPLHMHCPFCPRSEVYQDPVILKAHFRVKHVDKSLAFAGLKLLRCCCNCEIVGAIKGEKTFRGPHWHCYRCKNGFNRLDETIKHCKTHFRNPQTTFQIHIAQDVNVMLNNDMGTASHTLMTLDAKGEPSISETVTITSQNRQDLNSCVLNQASSDILRILTSHGGGRVLHTSQVAANETVGTSDTPGQTIMIITDDEATPFDAETVIGQNCQVSYSDSEGAETSKRIEELSQENFRLLQEKIVIEKQYNTQIDALKKQISDQADLLKVYRERETKLIEELSVPMDERITALTSALQEQHQDLLHQQLLRLKREYHPNNVGPNNTDAGTVSPAGGNHTAMTYLLEDSSVTSDGAENFVVNVEEDSSTAIPVTLQTIEEQSDTETDTSPNAKKCKTT